MNVSFTSPRSLSRLPRGTLYTLYVEGPVLDSCPPGSFPCFLASLQHQLTSFWQLTLTRILVNPSHSQEAAESRNHPGQSQNNIQSSQKRADPWLFQTLCNEHELTLWKWIARWAMIWGALEWLEPLKRHHRQQLQCLRVHSKGMCLDGQRGFQCSVIAVEAYNCCDEELGWWKV